MIRRARLEETALLAKLVFIVIEGMGLSITEKVPKAELTEVIAEAMKSDEYRYSYRNGLVCERDGQIAGVCFGYKGELEPLIDKPLAELVQEKTYRNLLRNSIESETDPGEWYLDTIVTHPEFRRQGVATELLEAVPNFAKEQGETVIGLNCEQDNLSAKQLYEKQGFVKVGERMIGPYLYDHMQKEMH